MFYCNRLLLGLGGRPENSAAPGHAVLTPLPRGTTGVVSWTVPDGVFELSMLAIGPGGNSVSESRSENGLAIGGGGGACRWANNIPVTPGEILEARFWSTYLTDGQDGPHLWVRRRGSPNFVYLLFAHAGNGGRPTVGVPGRGGGPKQNAEIGGEPPMGSVAGSEHPTEGFYIGGGDGGDGGIPTGNTIAGGGGGAGGYTGNGGNGARTSAAGTAGAGGAGSGGFGNATAASSGGGVGNLGQGANGAAGTGSGTGGGSGGGGRVTCGNNAGSTKAPAFGAGAGAYDGTTQFQVAAEGTLRFLWGRGKNNGGRAFPSTNVASATA